MMNLPEVPYHDWAEICPGRDIVSPSYMMAKVMPGVEFEHGGLYMNDGNAKENNIKAARSLMQQSLSVLEEAGTDRSEYIKCTIIELIALARKFAGDGKWSNIHLIDLVLSAAKNGSSRTLKKEFQKVINLF
jgi:hypothetical protein